MRRMMLAASVAFVGSFGVAAAADLGGYHGSLKDERVYAPPASWSGFYLGVNAGYAWGNTDWEFPGPDTTTSPNMNGAIYGGQLGFNRQYGSWVLGAEVSFSGSNAGGSASCPNATFTCKSELDWLLLAGPRVGYAWGNLLGYVSGGYALASIKTSVKPPFPNFDDTQQHDGWAIGGGVEYLISPNVVLGVEYMHVDLSSQTYAESPFTPGVTRDVDGNMDIVRARLSYKFGHDYDALK